MSESIKEQITADLQKAKSEGKMRTDRIQEIVRDAFSQTIAEVKEGYCEVRATVKETFSKILETRKHSEETADKAPSSSAKSMALVVFKALSIRLLSRLYKEFIGLPHQYAKLKNQAINLDANLTERYGDRYFAVKQRLENAAAWYNTATAQAKTMEPNVLQQRQVEVENKLGEAGATFAQKEQHVKQQLKALLQTATAKL